MVFRASPMEYTRPARPAPISRPMRMQAEAARPAARPRRWGIHFCRQEIALPYTNPLPSPPTTQ